MTVSAYSATADGERVGELRTSMNTGRSAGLTFSYSGDEGMSAGSWRRVRAIIAWTSWAAESMSRLRLNCRVTRVRPWELDEVIESRPGMLEKAFSSGVATVVAIVSGLAPGRLALTDTVGKSTFGRSLTGRPR